MRILDKWLEKRIFSLAKWEEFLDLMGATPSSSGVNVSESSAMETSSVLACLRVLSFTMAMLPLPLYERQANGGKKRAVDHPLYFLLHDEPNNYQTAFEFRQMMMHQLLLYGNFYALIKRNKASGVVEELLPFASPANMEVQLFDNEPRYKYTFESGQALVLTQDDVLHIKGMSTNGLLGLKMLDKGRESIGLAIALQQFAAKFFAKGANISGVLEHPGKLSKEAQERLKASWDKAYSGVSNAHKTAILEEGMKYARMGATPEEAQALESRKFQTIEVARIFGVPPHMIGDLERATFSNIEHQGIEFVTYCLLPWATLIQQRISKQLLNLGERRRYFAEFVFEALMRGDYKSRQEGLHIMRQDGIISQDEWRALENMNPVDTEESQAYLVNGNMITTKLALEGGAASLKQSEPSKDPPDEGEDERKALFEPLIRDAFNRIKRREQADITRKIKEKNREASGINRWFLDFLNDHAEFMRRTLTPIAESMAIQGQEMGMESLISGHIDQLRGAIQGALLDDDPQAAVLAALEGRN